MDKTKDAINSFMSKSGRHDTTVHESVNPSVQHETVRPSQHEEVNTALDREVHQDHYHHTIQPIKHKEVMPEQHHHNVGNVEHRSFDHRDHSKTKSTLEAEAAKFKDESKRVETTHTQSHVPVVQGEHVHHHVHETYQPVIQKETTEPHIVHTTVPIHETHHNEAKHHGTSTLPAVSMGEFKRHGGTHKGGQHDHHFFEGCPDVEGGAHSHNKGFQNITSSGHTGALGTSTDPEMTSSHDAPSAGNAGPHGSKLANKLDPRVDSGRDHRVAGTKDVTDTGGSRGSMLEVDAQSAAGRDTTAATTQMREGTSGSNNPRVATAADPRVDSDRDHRAAGSNIDSGLGNTSGSAGVEPSGHRGSGPSSAATDPPLHSGTTGTHDSAAGSRIGNSTGSAGVVGRAATTAAGNHGHTRKDSGHGLSDYDQAGSKPSLLEKVGEKLGFSHSNESSTSRDAGVFSSVNSKR